MWFHTKFTYIFGKSQSGASGMLRIAYYADLDASLRRVSQVTARRAPSATWALRKGMTLTRPARKSARM